MWTQTEAAVDLLRTLERQLDASGIDYDYRNRNQDLRKDLRKLIKLLENPIFKHNLTVQESIRSLKEQLIVREEISPNSSFRTSTSHYDLSQRRRSSRNEETTPRIPDEEQQPRRETIRLRLMLPAATSQLGWTLVDKDKSIFVHDVQPDGFIARDGRIEAGDELLLVDGRPVADGGLSSLTLQRLLSEKRSSEISNRTRSSTHEEGFLPEGDYYETISDSYTELGGSNPNTQHDYRREEGAAYLDLVLAKGRGSLAVGRPFESEYKLASSSEHTTSTPTTRTTPTESTSEAAAVSSASCPDQQGAVGENNMVLHGDWTQIQIVDLENDGSGLGFGIVGGRSTGVVVKTILAGGAADRDGRLRPGDHLLQINDVHLHGMSSEQVAMILRQQDQSLVKIVVGRPADATSPHPSHSSYQDPEAEAKQADNRGSFTVPTKLVMDPLMLEQHLQQVTENWTAAHCQQQQQQQKEQATTSAVITTTTAPDSEWRAPAEVSEASGSSSAVPQAPAPAPAPAPPPLLPPPPQPTTATKPLTMDDLALLSPNTFAKENRSVDEYDPIEVTLRRDPKTGLGIAVACYVHKKEEISGLFVRNLLPGSVSDVDGRVHRHDQIVKVNDNDVDQVKSHKEAIKYLAESGESVKLTLIRYHHSSIKFRFLEMLAAQDSDRQVVDLHSVRKEAAASPQPPQPSSSSSNQEDAEETSKARQKWQSVIGEDQEIIVAIIPRPTPQTATDGSGALVQQHYGLALEGTVDVVNGTELRPHHYIRAVSPDSAAGVGGRLRAGDELLEANGHDLYGRSYLEVVDVLRQLATTDVRLICARPKEDMAPSSSATTGQTRTVQPPSSLYNDRLVKAKSEVSLYPGAGASISCDSLATDRILSEVATALRSRSLEPLNNLAVWSTHPTHIELAKGDRGLGFSVLDYQDPLHPSDTVIVVRSLVPGGVAATDGRVVPGDRLLYVNDVDLTSHASLEKAVDALKSSPKGLVRLGIAKPLSLVDEHVHSPIITQTERLLAKGSMSSPQPNRKWSTERQPNRNGNVNGGHQRYQQQYRSGDVYGGDDIAGPPPPLPRLPPPDWTLEARRRLYPEKFTDYDQQQQQQHGLRYHHHHQRRQFGVRHTASASAVYGVTGEGPSVVARLPQSLTASTLISGSYISMSSWSGGSSPSLSPAASPSLLRGSWASDVIHLPPHLEQAAKIKKSAADPLGVTVEAVDKAINGCLVKSMLRSGAFGKDGRVHVGDFLVRMNNENLRNTTNSQARAILKRTNLLGATDLSVSYIPGVEAEKYRDYVAKQLPPESPVPNVNRLSPKSPYVPRRQGAHSTGESDASSDVEMSLRDGEAPLSPGAASSQFGGVGGSQQPMVADSDSFRRPSPLSSQQQLPHHPQHHQPQHLHDAVSMTSSAAFVSATSTGSAPIEYAHYPVSGDQYLPSHYEQPAPEPEPEPTTPLHLHSQFPASSSHEFRPHAFPETLPTVAEVSEPRQSPEKEEGSAGGGETASSRGEVDESKAKTPTPPPGSPPKATTIAEISPLPPATTTATLIVEETNVTTKQLEEITNGSDGVTTVIVADAPSMAPAAEPAQPTKQPPDSPTTSATSSSLSARSKYWGEPRTVELVREAGRSLGISIVGGRVEVSKGAPGTGTTVSGIFIKSVIAQSPAGRCGQLNMGDRILSVNGVDLKEATHEQAVEVIRNAANPVRFIVQSLHSIPVQSSTGSAPSSPFAKQASPRPSLDVTENHQHQQQQQRKAQTELEVGVEPAVAPPADEIGGGQTVFTFDASSNPPSAAAVVQPMPPAIIDEHTDARPAESIQPAVVEASVVVVEPTSPAPPKSNAPVSEGQQQPVAPNEDDDEVEKSERFDTFATDRPLVGTGHGALGRRPSEPLKAPSVPPQVSVDRRYSAYDRSSATVGGGPPLKPFRKPGSDVIEGAVGHYRGRVDSASAAAVRKGDDDSESEDEFGYTKKKMRSKYGDLKGDLMMTEFDRGTNGLGLSLAGHRDRSKLSVFVVGIQPESPAAAEGKVAIGDELLEINGIVLHGRSHLNASAIIKGVQDSKVKLILLRRPDAIDDMAVNPIQYNPSMQRWLSYSGMSSGSLTPAKTSSTATTAAGVPPPPASKASVTGAMSVDLSYVMNDKRKESAERTASVQGSHHSKQPSIGGGVGTTPSSLVAEPPPPTSPNFATPRQVKVHRGPSGFGITLTDGTTNDNIRGIFITHISPESPAAQEKILKIGDQVLAVNGRSVNDLSSSKVAEMIQDNTEVELTVSSNTIVPLPHSPAASTAKRTSNLGPIDPVNTQRKVSGSISPNLGCNQIVAGYETYIEIEKAGKGLGLSIVGGTDTVLGSVVIHEVYPDGAAAKDGRLQPGDQLLEVNGQSLREVAHESAITILRQTPSKVRLMIYRDPNLQLSLLDPTQIYNIFEVELMKKPGKGLGLSIVGRKTEPGVFISEVVKGGVADGDGRLMQGDQILAVNGQDLTNAMQEQAATILKTCMGKVSLKVGRWKLTSGNNPNPSFPVSKILAPSGHMSPTVPGISVHQASAAKATLVTIEEPPAAASPKPTIASPRPSPSPPPHVQQPIDVQVTTTGGGSLTNGDHALAPTMTTVLPVATTPTLARAPSPSSPIRDGRTTPEPSSVIKRDTPSTEGGGGGSSITPAGSPLTKAASQSPGPDEAKGMMPTLELSEEGCDTVIVEMQKVPERPLGMGIGKRPRGILVTSIQPGTVAADKLKVGDRILAVNGQVVTDQQSAVNYVKSSGPRLVLQLARPRPDCMDLATGHIRTSLTTIKQVTLQRGPEGGFGFSIDGGAEEKVASNISTTNTTTGGGSSSSSGGSGSQASTDRPPTTATTPTAIRTPIYICSITKNGPASQDGRIKMGDVILAVNGRSLQNASHADAVQLIKQSTPKVALMLMANPKQKRRNS